MLMLPSESLIGRLGLAQSGRGGVVRAYQTRGRRERQLLTTGNEMNDFARRVP